MAFRSGFVTGFGDDSGGFTFETSASGYSMPIKKETQGGESKDYSVWNHYGAAIPVQTTLIYTGGVSALHQTPIWTLITAADAGSGRGEKMVYRTPSDPLAVTDAEALTIIADGTYGDGIAQ